jgi:uncharacterized membrane protein
MPRFASFRPSYTLRGRRFYGLRGWAGKPTHPPLTDLPIAAYLFAATFEIVGRVWPGAGHDAFLASTWVMTAGFVVSVGTATTGLLDFPATTRGTQVRRTVVAHASIMVTTTILVLLCVLLRLSHWSPTATSTTLITGLTLLTAVTVAFGAWIGNDLVFEHGFRVEYSRDTPAWNPDPTDVLPGGTPIGRRGWTRADAERRAEGRPSAT